MNFLSHYHFDQKPESNPMYHLGLVFPDFLKAFTQQRFKPLKKGTVPSNLMDGAKQHLERDAHFHNHAFFHDGCKIISQIINNSAAKSIPKTFFLAHIILEITLDRVLMDKDIRRLDNFYSELENIDKNEIKLYFQDNQLKNYDTFIQKLDSFTLSKWMYKYLDDENFPFSLNRVYFRIGYNQEWNKEQNEALIKALPIILSKVKKALPSYLD